MFCWTTVVPLDESVDMSKNLCKLSIEKKEDRRERLRRGGKGALAVVVTYNFRGSRWGNKVLGWANLYI